MINAFTVNKLSHTYNKSYILNNIDFFVQQGDFFAIIGPNGSGKTTLVRLLSGIEKVSQGSIKIMGNSIKRYTPKLLAKILAYVPQNIPVNFPFTVIDMVSMGRYPYLGVFGIGKVKDQKIIEKSMKFTGVDALSNRMMYQLSGGERQRVFLAKAICQQTKLIILDEPTSALDIAYQIKIMDLMEKLVKLKKMTIIIVTHDINLAAMYCNKILLMKAGSIINYGNPKDVLNFKILEYIYDCPILVNRSTLKNVLQVIPVPSRYCKT